MTITHTIKCAHCKNRHGSVQEVRECAAGIVSNASGVAWHRAAEWAQDADKRQPVATKHQSIFDVKGVNPNGTPRTSQNNTAAPVFSAREVVVTEQAALKAVEAKVPSGHYAIITESVTKFYRVDAVTEGRWKGYTFVKAQASDELHNIRNPKVRLEILTAIAADVRGALIRYGMEIGKCGVCHRTLTDPISRTYGIGPKCRGDLEKAGY